jgi:Uma2 family endonuclease
VVSELAAVSFEEYLAIEEAGVRHELVGGRVYDMSGGTERHDLMVGALLARFRLGAITAGCRPFDGNRALRTPSGSAYYPDVMVVCGRAADVRYEDDATVVVEVLSPSTRATDRREKLEAYRRLPSLRHYLLVDPVIRHVEVFSPDPRSGEPVWRTYGPGQSLDTPYGTLVVDEVYDEVDSMATT